MAQFDAYFKRYEKKYLLSPEQYEKLRQRLPEHFEPDRFHLSEISNIYFDTPTNRLVRASNEKPDYKEKFRVRVYGDPETSTEAFLELKKKFHGVVYKRREAVPLNGLDIDDICSGTQDTQISREIRRLFDFYGPLKPAMFLSYRRIALRGIEDPELRITFDGDIRYRTDDLSFKDPDSGKRLLPNGEILMEIKTGASLPMWLSRILSELKIWPASFSKYGKAFLQEEVKRIGAPEFRMKPVLNPAHTAPLEKQQIA